MHENGDRMRLELARELAGRTPCYILVLLVTQLVVHTDPIRASGHEDDSIARLVSLHR